MRNFEDVKTGFKEALVDWKQCVAGHFCRKFAGEYQMTKTQGWDARFRTEAQCRAGLVWEVPMAIRRAKFWDEVEKVEQRKNVTVLA